MTADEFVAAMDAGTLEIASSARCRDCGGPANFATGRHKIFSPVVGNPARPVCSPREGTGPDARDGEAS